MSATVTTCYFLYLSVRGLQRKNIYAAVSGCILLNKSLFLFYYNVITTIPKVLELVLVLDSLFFEIINISQ